MSTLHPHRRPLLARASIILSGPALALPLHAATAAPPSSPSQTSETQLSTVVVTGTASGVTERNAPYAINSQSSERLQRNPPTSIADAIKSVPGFWSEPSGGLGGNQNLYVRGLPDGGWYNVQLQQDGLTLFDEPQESFFNIDNLYRLDLTTERLETVTGGTSPIFANNAPGGTVNAISRWGKHTPEGALRSTVGRYGLRRLDGYASGPVNDNWLYSLGGFIRDSDGLRKPGYKADEGGQFRFALSRLFDQGRLDLEARLLDDRNALYNPIPLRDPRDPSRSLGHWLDQGRGTLLSDNFRQRTLKSGDTSRNSDLQDGAHVRSFQLGAHLDFDLGDSGWTLNNRMRYTHAEVNVDALFSGADPQGANAYLNGHLKNAQQAFPGTARLGYTRAGAPGSPLDPSSGSGLVAESGWWSVRSQMNNLVDDTRFSRSFDTDWGTHDLTLGGYADLYSFKQDRLQGNLLTEVANRPNALDVVAYDAAGNIIGKVTDQGFTRYGSGRVKGDVEGKYLSTYLLDTWHLTPTFALDGGLRFTRMYEDGRVYDTTTRNLGDSKTLADDQVIGLGSHRHVKRDSDNLATSWTIGSSFLLNEQTTLFARYTESERLPRLQNGFWSPAKQVTQIKQAEGGIRFGSDNLSLSSILYWSSFDSLDLSALVVNSQGNVTNLQILGSTRTYGLENTLNWRLNRYLGVNATLTLQDPETRSLNSAGSGGVDPASFEGKQLPRIPKLLASLQPTLYFTAFGLSSELSVTAYHTGKRYTDYSNVTELPAYTTYDASLLVRLSRDLDLQLSGSNLSNEDGLTEGNPRRDLLTGQGTDVTYGRPIFGRNYQASLTYHW